ncbi:MAG: dinitrogenase iron-molybdenum cofactor biosynthesis protein [Asgard group archaeon]|nr:dinitrogenase iron-molybdenum cofactor biosynthesis protein [Asgard group archaeon]
MKLAISAVSDTLDSEVDPRFGRCSRFLIVDTDNMAVEVMLNQAQYEEHGAGISAAQNIINKGGISAIISGNMGPNAYRLFYAANVKMYSYIGKISDGIIKLKNNQLIPIDNPTNRGHISTSGGRGQGRGMGQGRNRN